MLVGVSASGYGARSDQGGRDGGGRRVERNVVNVHTWIVRGGRVAAGTSESWGSGLLGGRYREKAIARKERRLLCGDWGRVVSRGGWRIKSQ